MRFRDAHDARALLRDPQRFAGDIDGRELRSRASEIERVGADPASDLQNPLPCQRSNCAKPGMCGSTRYLRASTSSRHSRKPTGFSEWRMLQGRASQVVANVSNGAVRTATGRSTHARGSRSIERRIRSPRGIHTSGSQDRDGLDRDAGSIGPFWRSVRVQDMTGGCQPPRSRPSTPDGGSARRSWPERPLRPQSS